MNHEQMMRLELNAANSYYPKSFTGVPADPLSVFLTPWGNLHIHMANEDVGVAHEGEFAIADIIEKRFDGEKEFYWIRL